ncbi:hypothetical protein C6P42_005372, partial [Pichia californica]
MLSAQTSAPVNKKLSNFSSSNNQDSTTYFHLHSPNTQDSSSMSSFNDEYDFKTADISSSAQTSTNSPMRSHNMQSNSTNNKTFKEPKLSSFNFYSGPSTGALGNKSHLSQFRKSLVISPSFNSITSNTSENDSFVSNIASTNETPTKNIGMVISPSIRALSDILTTKVTSQSQHNLTGTISEENEEEVDDDDNSTIMLKSLHRHPSSLIDDIYSPDVKSRSTFKSTNSADTLKIHAPSFNNYDSANQPNLIDLDTPVVETNQFSSDPQLLTIRPSFDDPNQTNYSDLFEAYSPVKGDSSYVDSTVDNRTSSSHNTEIIDKASNEKRFSNRFSLMSDNFNDFTSPALGYSEPVQSFNFINPSINRSFSKLSNISDSFHEIGYDDTYINNNNNNNNNNN